MAIARALGPKPSIVLADEPTGNLDSKLSREIMRLFKRFNEDENQTFVVVTHEDEFLEYADMVIRLVDGEIAERKAWNAET